MPPNSSNPTGIKFDRNFPSNDLQAAKVWLQDETKRDFSETLQWATHKPMQWKDLEILLSKVIGVEAQNEYDGEGPRAIMYESIEKVMGSKWRSHSATRATAAEIGAIVEGTRTEIMKHMTVGWKDFGADWLLFALDAYSRIGCGTWKQALLRTRKAVESRKSKEDKKKAKEEKLLEARKERREAKKERREARREVKSKARKEQRKAMLEMEIQKSITPTSAQSVTTSSETFQKFGPAAYSHGFMDGLLYGSSQDLQKTSKDRMPLQLDSGSKTGDPPEGERKVVVLPFANASHRAISSPGSPETSRPAAVPADASRPPDMSPYEHCEEESFVFKPHGYHATNTKGLVGQMSSGASERLMVRETNEKKQNIVVLRLPKASIPSEQNKTKMFLRVPGASRPVIPTSKPFQPPTIPPVASKLSPMQALQSQNKTESIKIDSKQPGPSFTSNQAAVLLAPSPHPYLPAKRQKSHDHPTSPAVKIFIGEDLQQWDLPLAFLCNNIPYFRPIMPSGSTTTDIEIQIQDIEAETFAQLLAWISDKDLTCEQPLQLSKLFALAKKFRVRDLAAAVMLRLEAETTPFDAAVVRFANENTPEGSLLRRLVVSRALETLSCCQPGDQPVDKGTTNSGFEEDVPEASERRQAEATGV